VISLQQVSNLERRALKRWHLIFYLRVFDEESAAVLGHIVDISESGMMLVSDDPIPVCKDFHVWVDVPSETGPRQRIQLKVRSLWSHNDINPDFYDTGFFIKDASADTVDKLTQLIEDFTTEFHIID
jgi:hypothetical protein